MEVNIIRGDPSSYGDGSGSGYGSGDGDGYGSGSGSGYGYGSGSGSSYGSGYGDGYGSGYGDGYGSGYGSGSGDGYGYGSSYGSGYGDGYGSGYGSGSGDGYGYGYGTGYGSGSGSSYGSGDGSGSREYWLATIPYFVSKWPEEQRARLRAAEHGGAFIAFWRSDRNGQPANNGSRMETASPGVVHTSKGPIALCSAGTLHATLLPPKWRGDRWWIVALHGEVVGDDDEEKYGCLKREILGECL